MDEFNQPLDANSQVQNTQNGLQFTPRLTNTMVEMAKWINFISIFMIVIMCFAAIAMVFAGSMMGMLMGNMGGGADAGLGAIAIVFMLVYLSVLGYMTYCLYTSARDIRRGIATNDQNTLENGFTSMRRYWKLVGIILAIILVIYALIFVFGIGAAAMMHH